MIGKRDFKKSSVVQSIIWAPILVCLYTTGLYFYLGYFSNILREMQDYHEMITDLIEKLENFPRFSYSKSDLKPLQQELNVLRNSPLPREAQALESATNNYQLQQERNSQLYSELTDQRLIFAKKIIVLERHIEKLQNEINELTKEESDLKDKLELLDQPSKNALFVELMKGFNIKGEIVVKPQGYETITDDVDELWEKL